LAIERNKICKLDVETPNLMTLEEEIKSSRLIPVRQRALLNILFTASWLDCILTRHLRPFGLTNPQYNILRILNGSAPKGLSILDIKERMLDRSSNVSRLVAKLDEQGYIERITDQMDKRVVIVSISEKGKSVMENINMDRFHFGNDALGAELSDEESALLASLLDKFRKDCVR
jgi:MarR family transcriptional regulator, 2-MHQ and catechol-resistance regulon repressor